MSFRTRHGGSFIVQLMLALKHPSRFALARILCISDAHSSLKYQSPKDGLPRPNISAHGAGAHAGPLREESMRYAGTRKDHGRDRSRSTCPSGIKLSYLFFCQECGKISAIWQRRCGVTPPDRTPFESGTRSGSVSVMGDMHVSLLSAIQFIPPSSCIQPSTR